MRQLLLMLAFLLVAPLFISAQSTLPDFRNVNLKDRYIKMVMNEMKMTDSEMTKIEAQINKAEKSISDAHKDLQKNPAGLSDRLKDIESHFNNQLKNIMGENRYKTYRENYTVLTAKYFKL